MANTRKPATKRRLAKLAEASGRSSNFLISDAVESYAADQERMLAETRQADRQVKFRDPSKLAVFVYRVDVSVMNRF